VLQSSAQIMPDEVPEAPSLLPEDLVPLKPLEGEGGQDFLPSDPVPNMRGRGCQAEPRISELDDLFFQLKHTLDGEKAARIARQIQAVWSRTESDTLDMLMQWAEAAIEKEDYAQALDFLDNMIALAPECPEAFMRRASVHIQQNDLGAALLDLNEVLQREPRHYNAIMQLGMVMEMLEKPQKAIKLYEKALELYPQFTRLQRRLGRLLEAVDDVSV